MNDDRKRKKREQKKRERQRRRAAGDGRTPVERAAANFRAKLDAAAPHPAGFAEACLAHPPWVVYEFGVPPRRGLILMVSRTPGGFAATLDVLHRHNQTPPLMFERRVSGIGLDALTPVGIDRDVLARWTR